MKRLIKVAHRKLFGNDSFRENWYNDEPWVGISKKRKRELKKMGFLPSSDILFDFNRYGYENYINFRDYRKLHPINGVFSKLIDDKSFLPVLFRDKPRYLPDFYGTIDKGKYIHGTVNNSISAGDSIQYGVEKYGKIVLKPKGGSGGKGFIILDKKNILDNIHNVLATGKSYFFSNYMYNESIFNDIFPGSLNTMRVLFFKSKSGEMEIVKLMMKIGTNQSYPVDNAGAGGMVFSVEQQTGEMGPGRIYANRDVYESHIDNGTKITGIIIPGWERKLRSIYDILRSINFLKWGGIDIGFTDAGPKITEINSLPSLRISQIDAPLFVRKEIKDLFFSIGYGAG